ncbi:hypothetical protein EEJ42_10875 [Streptomyces botrytidirepellens]|uniref:Uncharacterized protein n=1 Tax=Streptomyces botrytidirepellens TaxID=2486417 RepID=A0A3M8WN00_9ACTN|nr:hypothetical protein EEJ42_10875 [Streptomyces botrytidirepellens]
MGEAEPEHDGRIEPYITAYVHADHVDTAVQPHAPWAVLSQLAGDGTLALPRLQGAAPAHRRA